MTRSGSIDAASKCGGTVPPETKYVRLGEDRIAYQSVGQGPPDLVVTTGTVGSIDSIWEDQGRPCFSVDWRRSHG